MASSDASKENIMKKIVVALLMVASSSAFAGYSAEVCNVTETGIQTDCRMVYFNRTLGVPSKYVAAAVGCENDPYQAKCVNSNGHVPAVLSQLNKWFSDRGFTAAPEDNIYRH